LFGNGYGYNTLIQYQPLYSAKDNFGQNSEGSLNYNLNNHTETILSTDGR